MKMEKEIEVKLDMPLSLHKEEFLAALERLLGRSGWKIDSKREDTKTLTYHDTSDYYLYQNNLTLRRGERYVGKPGIYRYDFKTGRGLDRREEKHWANEILSSSQISDLFHISFGTLAPVAAVQVNPILWNLSSYDDRIELKLDTCELTDGRKFRELEFELLDGEESSVFRISDLLAGRFGLAQRNQQKYSRVLEMLRLPNGGSELSCLN